MAAPRKRAGKRARARKSSSAKVLSLAFDMEEPLNDAIDAVRALHLMGHGLTELVGDDEGRAVTAVAWTACLRLDAVQVLWRDLCKSAVRARDVG